MEMLYRTLQQPGTMRKPQGFAHDALSRIEREERARAIGTGGDR
jgi:hypothetical protein